ncbi:MAG: trypsin-like peptidase domain-containing protein [Oscillospiraceae bacterium]|nr:trypsin-like peptidase domain-containing protein [Oscillospiraceae bacterium]
MKKNMKAYSFLLTVCLLLALVVPQHAVGYADAVSIFDDEIQIFSKCLTTGEETTQSFGGAQNALSYSSSSTPITSVDPVYPSWMTEEVDTGGIGISPFTIIGNDDRTRVTNTAAFPFCAIVHVETTWPNGEVANGSGFMWTDRVVITAGHVVYDSSRGGWAKSIRVWPGRDGTTIRSGPHNGWWAHAGGGFVSSGKQDEDYGVIELSTAPDVGAFGMSVESNSTLNSLFVTVAGYPSPVPTGQTARTMWQHSGNTTSPTTSKIFYPIDTTTGQSGSPVYKSGSYAVGIHAHGTGGTGTSANNNSGVRITQDLFNWFMTFK